MAFSEQCSVSYFVVFACELFCFSLDSFVQFSSLDSKYFVKVVVYVLICYKLSSFLCAYLLSSSCFVLASV